MKVKKIALILLCLVMLVSVAACSSDAVEKEVYDAVVSERDYAVSERDKAVSERDTLKQEVSAMEGELSEAAEDISNKDKEISELKDQLAEKDAEIKRLKSELDKIESVADAKKVKDFANTLDIEGIDVIVYEEDRVIVITLLFNSSMEEIASYKDLIDGTIDDLVSSFSETVKMACDMFAGWDAIGLVETNDDVYLGVVVNGTVFEK